jgi:hypothetical protein
MSPGVHDPAELLATATDVLRQQGFTVTTESLDGVETGWALAESELFILAVAAARDLEGLRQVESLAAPELIGRLGPSAGIGGKRWDAYLVLICGEDADTPDEARALVDIQYDTLGVRRLVAVGVEPTGEDIRGVLRPFLPLPPPSPEGLTDAFEGLQEQLVLNGVDESESQRIVAAFQDRGHLNDV